jgi:hypothetical protein
MSDATTEGFKDIVKDGIDDGDKEGNMEGPEDGSLLSIKEGWKEGK